MKPPQANHSFQNTRTETLQRMTLQRVVANQTFVLQNEFVSPSFRTVWSVAGNGTGDTEDQKRRKKR